MAKRRDPDPSKRPPAPSPRRPNLKLAIASAVILAIWVTFLSLVALQVI